ncbi:MAG: twitching motility protein PilT [Pseudonocardiales bacterium]|nr:twitching motility protein PilT [Pseudonocardiales bacterium]
MRLILDAGAFIALGRDNRAMWRRLKAARRTGQLPVTHGGVVGQVWRGGGARQALLARALNGIDVRALDEQLGRRSGALLARTGTSDVIDAALVLLAEDTDHIATSDLSDLRVLAEAADRHVELIPV